jgi:N-methylhydantoinase B/oxoprolinase/acetone carboxylase alpha subunit
VIGGTAPDGTWLNPLLQAHPFSYGETFKFESTGGGGWGNPLDREIDAVYEDVLDEYISVGRAREQYGVVVDAGSMQLDRAASEALRATLA